MNYKITLSKEMGEIISLELTHEKNILTLKFCLSEGTHFFEIFFLLIEAYGYKIEIRGARKSLFKNIVAMWYHKELVIKNCDNVITLSRYLVKVFDIYSTKRENRLMKPESVAAELYKLLEEIKREEINFTSPQ